MITGTVRHTPGLPPTGAGKAVATAESSLGFVGVVLCPLLCGCRFPAAAHALPFPIQPVLQGPLRSELSLNSPPKGAMGRLSHGSLWDLFSLFYTRKDILSLCHCSAAFTTVNIMVYSAELCALSARASYYYSLS